MRSGISLSYPATVTQTSGSAVSGYPASNLGDTLSPRTVFRSNAAAQTLAFDLGAEYDVGFVGLMQHNGGAGATRRVRLYDAGAGLVHDSTALPCFPTTGPQAHFLQSTPYVLTAGSVMAQTGVIDLSSQAWEIGCLEVGGWWEWTDVSVPREFGLGGTVAAVTLADGADHVQAQWAPRVWRGRRLLPDVRSEQDTFTDFQNSAGLRTPFAFVWDYDDPATWPRECFLARNAALPALTRGSWPSATMSFDFEEHLR